MGKSIEEMLEDIKNNESMLTFCREFCKGNRGLKHSRISVSDSFQIDVLESLLLGNTLETLAIEYDLSANCMKSLVHELLWDARAWFSESDSKDSLKNLGLPYRPHMALAHGLNICSESELRKHIEDNDGKLQSYFGLGEASKNFIYAKLGLVDVNQDDSEVAKDDNVRYVIYNKTRNTFCKSSSSWGSLADAAMYKSERSASISAGKYKVVDTDEIVVKKVKIVIVDE